MKSLTGPRLRPEDYSNAEISIQVENATSGTAVPQGPGSRLVEMSEDRITITLPDHTCAVGHTLNVRIVVKHTPRGVAPRFGSLVADQFILVTAKVRRTEPTQQDHLRVELELFQVIEREWKRFIDAFIHLQIGIEKSLSTLTDSDSLLEDRGGQGSVQPEQITNFLSGKKILIVDERSEFDHAAKSELVAMGATASTFLSAQHLDDAQIFLAAHHPQILVLGTEGESLERRAFVHEWMIRNPDPTQRLVLAVSPKNSQSLIAWTADLDLDALLILPFVPELFQNTLTRLIRRKLSPTPYGKTLLKGREHLERKDFGEALKYFRSARAFSKSPSLACYYEGLTRQATAEWENAERCFREGLELNPEHYRCLSGFFDLLIAQGKYQEVEAIAVKLAELFPVGPDRIPALVRLAVRNDRTEDIFGIYDAVANVDTQDRVLSKNLAAGLIIAAKSAIRNKDLSSAIAALRRAEGAARRNESLLLEIGKTFLEGELKAEFSQFVRRQDSKFSAALLDLTE